MNPLYVAAAEVQDFCLQQGWRFCLIGGMAILRWGELRTTRDVDLSLLTRWGEEPEFIDPLLGKFPARLTDARAFALRARIVLVTATNGVPIDIALAAIPYEERAIERADYYEYGKGVSLLTASAEDLVVTKAFAGRAQDWVDIEGIIIRQEGRLDRRLIFDELTALCDEQEHPEIVDRLAELFDRLSQS